ncbi:hypothetical protein V8F20_007977 [Naviculisporaceae sp. PSN 640]
MFGADRQQVLESSRWWPTDDSEHLVAAVDAWNDGDGYHDAEQTLPVRRQQLVSDNEIEHWISYTDQRGRSRLGGIRLLLCERRGWSPTHIHFPITESTFYSVESSFRLPEETLPIMRLNEGQFFHKIQHADTAQCSISIVVKLPQMFQLGNHGISLSHSFQAGTTSAFVHGWNLIRSRHEVTSETITPVMDRIETLLQSSFTSNPSSLSNPLLLPAIILKDHVTQIQSFLDWKLISEVGEIEKQLRVTKSARLGVARRRDGKLNDRRKNDLEELKRLMADEQQRTDLTTDLNTTLTDTLNLLTVMKWDQRYCQFLMDVQERIRKLNKGAYAPPDDGLDAILRYLDCNLQSNIGYVETMVARLNLQLSVLYNLAAQTETDLTSRMTRAAVLDSSAMKTLALVTAIFLPPTFVATLFSMTMFDWQASSSSQSASPSSDTSGQIIVPQFWIYWAISVPLTIVILLAWRVWWHFQKESYERRFQKQVDGMAEEPSLRSRFSHWRTGQGMSKD